MLSVSQFTILTINQLKSHSFSLHGINNPLCFKKGFSVEMTGTKKLTKNDGKYEIYDTKKTQEKRIERLESFTRPINSGNVVTRNPV